MERSVDLSGLFAEGKCDQDFPVGFGDVIDIPEADHILNQAWPGFSQAELQSLTNCLARTVHIVVKGQTNNYSLTGPAFLYSGLHAAGPLLQVQNEFEFWISSVLQSSRLLLASSDLSRIKVTRRDPVSGKDLEWIVDCSNSGSPPHFWVRHGDIIEVPDR